MLHLKKYIASFMRVSILTIAFLWCLSFTLFAQPSSTVTVLEPAQNGEEVGMYMQVKGTAILPKNHFLWILAHRIDDQENSWWPQGEVEVNPQNATWTQKVKFGEERDIGYQFKIAVIILAQDEHDKLSRYWFMVQKTGKSNPIMMPPTTALPTYRIVKKVRHASKQSSPTQ